MAASNKKCRLVLDSCCDLPRQMLDTADIEFFRFPYLMEDGEHLDDLGLAMDPSDFYGRLRKGEVSTTAQLPLPTLIAKFEEWAAEGTPTVYLAFTAGLSGTFETASVVVEDVKRRYPEWECYLVDTLLASVAEGLLAYEAIRQVSRGMTAAQLAKWASEARWYVNCLFCLDSLETLQRGGRIPDAAARLGEKLKAKPLLNFNADGTLRLAGVARGSKKALKSLVEAYDKGKAGDPRTTTVIVASADDESGAKWVAEHLNRPKSSIPPLMCNVGPTIGSHVGPGMVAVAYWGQDRRNAMSIADRLANKIKRGGDQS